MISCQRVLKQCEVWLLIMKISAVILNTKFQSWNGFPGLSDPVPTICRWETKAKELELYPGHTAVSGRTGIRVCVSWIDWYTSECQDLIRRSINVSCPPLGLGQWFSNGGILFWVEYFQRIPIKTAGLKRASRLHALPLASKAILWKNSLRQKVVWKSLSPTSCCLVYTWPL